MNYSLNKSLKGEVVLSVTGVFERHETDDLRHQLKEFIDNGTKDIVVDLYSLHFLNSQLIAILIALYNIVSTTNGTLKIINVKPSLMSVFKSMRLDSRFQIELIDDKD
ncbi:MAG: STAS domain-containing protein [Candidatus Riflebacteria bacterium]|nr:STAS domain-containing protein [Candidatus Riflebacteria bacterium]